MNNQSFIIFTVSKGESTYKDNLSTEMVHRVLNKHGVDKQITVLDGKRCFIVPNTQGNKLLVDTITHQYGTSQRLVHK